MKLSTLTRHMRHPVRLCAVVLLTALLLPVSSAQAAEVASAGAADDYRATVVYDSTGQFVYVRGYFATHDLLWSSYSSTLMATGASPHYLEVSALCPGGTFASGSVHSAAVRRSTAVTSVSGTPMPAQSFELKLKVATGSSCSMTPPTGTPSQIRLDYSGSSAAQFGSTAAGITMSTGSTWGAYPADHYPGGSSGSPTPPTLACTRSVDAMSDGRVRVQITETFTPSDPVALAAAVFTVGPINGVATGIFPTVAGHTLTVLPANIPESNSFYVTLTATFSGYSPSTRSCLLYVNLDDPSQTTAELPSEDSGYGCPSGWGLLNPANILELGKCMFIPRPDAADDILGTDPLDASSTLTETLDDTSIYYPVSLAGSIALDLVDQVLVEDGQIGSCTLIVGWGNSGVGYTGSPSDGLPSFPMPDSIAEFGMADGALVNTQLCPTSSWRSAVTFIRTLSMIAAGTAGIFMSIRFVKELGTYKAGGA